MLRTGRASGTAKREGCRPVSCSGLHPPTAAARFCHLVPKVVKPASSETSGLCWRSRLVTIVVPAASSRACSRHSHLWKLYLQSFTSLLPKVRVSRF